MRGHPLRALALALGLGVTLPACAVVDVDALWDYRRPAVTEAVFRAELRRAGGDDALVLRTQIARTLGLRDRFADATAELNAIEPALAAAGPEPRVRALLERGRVLRSSGRPVESLPWFHRAYALADQTGLQVLAGDALHMLALAEPDLDDRIRWNQRTIAYALKASDPKARRWEAPALNNLGYDLVEVERFDEALPMFRRLSSIHAAAHAVERDREARAMVAHVLRRLGRLDEALALLLALEREWEAVALPQGDVFDELAEVYAAKGDAVRAAEYRGLVAELAAAPRPQ